MRQFFRRFFLIYLLIQGLFLGALPPALALESTLAIDQVLECDVIVAGGSTAALATALTSARKKQITCWVEPTDWPGGQLTSSAMSAIDYASHQVNGINLEALAKHPANLPKELARWLDDLGGNPGECWVSWKCYEPQVLLNQYIRPAIEDEVRKGYLHLLTNAVVKSVRANSRDRLIQSVFVIQRIPLQGQGYTQHFSAGVTDWYTPEDSTEFIKQRIELRGHLGLNPVVVDATEFGDILVLAGAQFLQAQEENEGDLHNIRSNCGQAHVFPLVMEYSTTPVSDGIRFPEIPERSLGFYSIQAFKRQFTWGEIWSYRRIRSAQRFKKSSAWTEIVKARPGELSLQNWNPGNDYPFGYMFKSREDTLAERDNWQGGLDLKHLAEAETHALGWYQWLKEQAPATVKPYLRLNLDALGTQTGLSKFPYIRDTRRGIGLRGFIMTLDDMLAKAGQTRGTYFKDRVGIGVYKADMHPLKCVYPALTRKIHQILPYYLSYRSLVHQDYDNLMMAGKTMAQSFIVNMSTRTQITEFSSGIAAGVIAAYLSKYQLKNTELEEHIELVQAEIKALAPIDWTGL